MWTSVQAGPERLVATRLQHSPPQSCCGDGMSFPVQQPNEVPSEASDAWSQHDSPQHEPVVNAVEANAFASEPT